MIGLSLCMGTASVKWTPHKKKEQHSVSKTYHITSSTPQHKAREAPNDGAETRSHHTEDQRREKTTQRTASQTMDEMALSTPGMVFESYETIVRISWLEVTG